MKSLEKKLTDEKELLEKYLLFSIQNEEQTIFKEVKLNASKIFHINVVIFS